MLITIIVLGIYFVGCLVVVFCEPIFNAEEDCGYTDVVIMWPIVAIAMIAVLPYVVLQKLIIMPISASGKKFFEE
jgi:hypothetical protein